ncbi:MAG: hypothetical protein RR496_04760, partial [Lachnospiraceae bacterium]
MMKKKLLTAVLTTFLVLSSAMSAVAADSKVVTFKGEAEKFVVGVEGNAQKGFTDMEPGESRELKLTLANEDSQEIRIIARAAKEMTPEQRKKMLNILKASFEEEFPDISDDVN